MRPNKKVKRDNKWSSISHEDLKLKKIKNKKLEECKLGTLVSLFNG